MRKYEKCAADNVINIDLVEVDELKHFLKCIKVENKVTEIMEIKLPKEKVAGLWKEFTTIMKKHINRKLVQVFILCSTK